MATSTTKRTATPKKAATTTRRAASSKAATKPAATVAEPVQAVEAVETATVAPQVSGGVSAMAARINQRRMENTSTSVGMQIPAQTGGSTGGVQRPATKAWVNVGYETTDPSTGESIFISLPVGIPLDDLQPRKVNSADPLVNQRNQARNVLLEAIRNTVEDMEQGTSQIMPQLQVQLLHTRDASAMETEVDDNPFIPEFLR